MLLEQAMLSIGWKVGFPSECWKICVLCMCCVYGKMCVLCGMINAVGSSYAEQQLEICTISFQLFEKLLLDLGKIFLVRCHNPDYADHLGSPDSNLDQKEFSFKIVMSGQFHTLVICFWYFVVLYRILGSLL